MGVFVLKNVKDLTRYGPQQPDLIKQGGSVAKCFHDCKILGGIYAYIDRYRYIWIKNYY